MALQYSFSTAANSRIITGVNWFGQTFTTDSTDFRRVTNLGFFTTRIATTSSGTGTLAIRATSAGLPTGANLCSGTFAYNVISESTQEWVEVAVGTPIDLDKNTLYSIIISFTTTTGFAFYESVTDQFANGNGVSSTNSGSSWTGQTYDGAFRVYCNDIGSKGSPMFFGGGVTIA